MIVGPSELQYHGFGEKVRNACFWIILYIEDLLDVDAYANRVGACRNKEIS